MIEMFERFRASEEKFTRGWSEEEKDDCGRKKEDNMESTCLPAFTPRKGQPRPSIVSAELDADVHVQNMASAPD